MNLFLSLATPEKSHFKNLKVDEVLIPSQKGELGILPGHTAMVSLLSKGLLKWRVASSWHKLEVSLGYLEVRKDQVVILADTAGQSE